MNRGAVVLNEHRDRRCRHAALPARTGRIIISDMGKRSPAGKTVAKNTSNTPAHDVARSVASPAAAAPRAGKPSSLLDTRVAYGCEICGDNLEQLAKLPDACVDLIYIDPPFNSNRTVEQLGEVFWGETKEKRAFEDRHASTQAYIEYMRRSLRPTRPRP